MHKIPFKTDVGFGWGKHSSARGRGYALGQRVIDQFSASPWGEGAMGMRRGLRGFLLSAAAGDADHCQRNTGNEDHQERRNTGHNTGRGDRLEYVRDHNGM